MNEEIIVRPDTSELGLIVNAALEMNIKEALTIAEDLVIADEYDAEVCNALLGKVKLAIERAKEWADARLKPLNETRALLMGDRDRLTLPLAGGEKILKEKMTAYLSEMKRKAQEAAQEAQRKAQEELQRRRAAEVKMLQEQGEHQAAAFVAQEAKTEVAPTVKTTKPVGPTGSVLKTTWSARLVSLEVLVIATAADLALPREQRRGLIAFLEFNQKAANSAAVGSQENLNIPGVAPQPNETTAHSAKKSTMLRS